MEWVFIRDEGEEVGAVGFIDRRVALVASFHDDREAADVGSGTPRTGSRSFEFECMAVLKVAMAARHNEIVQHWDGVFARDAEEMWLRFVTGLAPDALLLVYFSRGVNTLSRFQPGTASGGTIRQFAIRRGMEQAVERLYQAAEFHGPNLAESSPSAG